MVVAEQEVLTRDRVPVAETWDLTGIYAGATTRPRGDGPVDGSIGRVLASGDSLANPRPACGRRSMRLCDASCVLERITVYAGSRYDEDTTNARSQAMLDQATADRVRAGQSSRLVRSGMLAVPEETLAAISPIRCLRRIATRSTKSSAIGRTRARPRSKSCWRSPAISARTAREASAHSTMPILTMAGARRGGQLVELTKGRYLPAEDRETATSARSTTRPSWPPTNSTSTSCRRSTPAPCARTSSTPARGFPSARRWRSTPRYHEQVYDSLIDVTRAQLDIQALPGAAREAARCRQLEIYDSWVPLSEFRASTTRGTRRSRSSARPRRARRRVCHRHARRSDPGRWVDVHETKGKRSGAYSWGAYGSHPVILMNWNGTLSTSSRWRTKPVTPCTRYFADGSQPFQTRYPIFLAEIASTVNEVLLTWHLLGKMPAERRWSASRSSTGSPTDYRHARPPDHVRRVRTRDAPDRRSKQPLDLQQLNDLYADLYRPIRRA